MHKLIYIILRKKIENGGQDGGQYNFLLVFHSSKCSVVFLAHENMSRHKSAVLHRTWAELYYFEDNFKMAAKKAPSIIFFLFVRVQNDSVVFHAHENIKQDSKIAGLG